jgi:hypothetical protein
MTSPITVSLGDGYKTLRAFSVTNRGTKQSAGILMFINQ